MTGLGSLGQLLFLSGLRSFWRFIFSGLNMTGQRPSLGTCPNSPFSPLHPEALLEAGHAQMLASRLHCLMPPHCLTFHGRRGESCVQCVCCACPQGKPGTWTRVPAGCYSYSYYYYESNRNRRTHLMLHAACSLAGLLPTPENPIWRTPSPQLQSLRGAESGQRGARCHPESGGSGTSHNPSGADPGPWPRPQR